MDNQPIEYEDPWNGIDRKPYDKAWRSMLSLMLLTPIQLIAVGVGVYVGFLTNDGKLLTISIILSLVFMVIRAIFYEKTSAYCDVVAGDTNVQLWSNISRSLNAKYGEGTVVPYSDKPEKVAPPDGSNGIMDKISSLLVGSAIPVVWTDGEGEVHHKILDMKPGSREPELRNRKTPTK